MKKGIIYLCKTAVKGVYKIGRTDNLKSRKTILESNGYYNVAGLNLIYAVETEDMNESEKFIQELLASARIKKSELFIVDEGAAITLLSKIGKTVFPENSEVANSIKEEAVEMVASGLIPNGIYYCETKVDGKEYKANLKMQDNELYLLKGSQICNDYTKLNNSYKNVREQMVVENEVLCEDFEVSSVSSAASVVAGHMKNGWDIWKDEKGDKIEKYR